jgi:hypothetical protein
MTTHSYSCSHVLWDPECANIALPRSPVTGPADGGECAIMTAGDARVKPPSLIALWGSCWIEKATLLAHQGETSADVGARLGGISPFVAVSAQKIL